MSLKTKTEDDLAQVHVKRGLSGLMKGVVLGAGALLIFGLGLSIGNGKLTLGPHNNQTGLPAQLDYSSVNSVYQQLKDNYNGKLTAQQLTDGLKHGLAEATNDPYTEYFTAAEAKQFNSQLNNTFSGIGAELGLDSDKNLVVISPLDGFPAAKAGLKAQDIIATIDGTSTTGVSVDKAVSKIRGKSGTSVKLGIVRDKSQSLTLSITRQNIQAPSVTTKTLDNNIGYMHISTFATDTGSLAQKAAQSFKQQNVKGIVLDLRGNPGGLLDDAVSVSSLWLPRGKTVVTQKGTAGDQVATATGDDTLDGIPTVILIDEGSASASEITTGALHDNKAGYVIGEKSYGKGVVQQLLNLNDGSQLKVTVASWYRPNGDNINHKGITPDQIVKENDNPTADNDAQLQAAEAYLNK